jgi:hypothetical protein
MLNSKRASGAAGAVLLFTAAFLVGCGEEEEPQPGPGPYQMTEPKYALANVELAFNGYDVSLLDKCLADTFLFFFDPNDVGQKANGYVMPGSWARADFLQAARNMFSRAQSISIDNNWQAIGPPDPNENIYAAYAVPLKIAVVVGPNESYTLDDGTCDYEFKKDADGTWHLINWQDRSREAGCTGPRTLGRILAKFYL